MRKIDESSRFRCENFGRKSLLSNQSDRNGALNTLGMGNGSLCRSTYLW